MMNSKKETGTQLAWFFTVNSPICPEQKEPSLPQTTLQAKTDLYETMKHVKHMLAKFAKAHSTPWDYAWITMMLWSESTLGPKEMFSFYYQLTTMQHTNMISS